MVWVNSGFFLVREYFDEKQKGEGKRVKQDKKKGDNGNHFPSPLCVGKTTPKKRKGRDRSDCQIEAGGRVKPKSHPRKREKVKTKGAPGIDSSLTKKVRRHPGRGEKKGKFEKV